MSDRCKRIPSLTGGYPCRSGGCSLDNPCKWDLQEPLRPIRVAGMNYATQGESRLIEQVPGGRQSERGTVRQTRVQYWELQGQVTRQPRSQPGAGRTEDRQAGRRTDDRQTAERRASCSRNKSKLQTIIISLFHRSLILLLVLSLLLLLLLWSLL